MILRKAIVFIGVALMISGCQTAAQKPEKMWMRVDGKRTAGNAKFEQEFYLAGKICTGRAGGVAAGASPIYYSGIGGAISAGIVANERQQALMAMMEGCMAEKGYVLVPATKEMTLLKDWKPAP
jgi:hypothetical protein